LQIKTVFQEDQLGTGHAVRLLEKYTGDLEENILIITGDCPLLKSDTLEKLVKAHREENNAATIITAIIEDPFGYGRIVKDSSGKVIKIVEEKDASILEKKIKEINTSIYCFKTRYLFENLKNITCQNSQNEYYLTDVIREFVDKDLKVSSIIIEDQNEILGVNDRLALSKVEKIMQERINESLMISGVTIRDCAQTYIGSEVNIESDVVIEPQTFIFGKTNIKKGCRIGPFAIIEDSKIGEDTQIVSAVLKGCKIGSKNNIGPFIYLKPQTVTKTGARIGEFSKI